MDYIDITVPLRDGMFVYANNPEVHIERASSIAAGDAANVSRIDMGAHSGTHVDAPVHFIEGGAGAETLPLDPMIGPAVVVDATAVTGAIDAAAVDAAAIPAGTTRVLFKTRNSALWAQDSFTRDFSRFDGSGAQRLLDSGIELVGLDYLSIGDQDAHHLLLGAGVIALEGIDLRTVEPGDYRLICLPLKVVGCDGAPARALLTRL